MDWKVQRDALAHAIRCSESSIEALLLAFLFVREDRGKPLVGRFGDAAWEAQAQHVVPIDGGNARLDLALKRGDRKIALEVDGHQFHERKREQVIQDNERTAELTALGWIVLRISGSELWNQPKRAVDRIVKVLKSRSVMHEEPEELAPLPAEPMSDKPSISMADGARMVLEALTNGDATPGELLFRPRRRS